MEEEQDMMEQLESLTAEFEKNFAFLGSHYMHDSKPRIEEIMSEGTLDEDYINGVRELGVIMQ
ncbi:uncharacterized protein Bfra_002249 [Botrytis fragariae]|uniref:Uncharacterized protein n=1 Tax=Botrytis fragariae TaxID=1964551 RepID=A0A8H6EKR8_9HELO|nr:uncharacterized protein Bfra_002249 [Botrytis fragariae]KAF5875853.1 hypothetical protein Bfra_002249 [Botrytis fragariae]